MALTCRHLAFAELRDTRARDGSACGPLSARERGAVQSPTFRQGQFRGLRRDNNTSPVSPRWPSAYVIDPDTSSKFCVLGSKYRSPKTCGAVRSEAAAVSSVISEPGIQTLDDVDWSNFGFGMRDTDFMFMMKCDRDGQWQKGELRPFGNLEMSPAAGVLNYGQGLFEGLKAYRTDDGRVLLFRPDENALRMINGADRLSIPPIPVDMFVEAVKQTVLSNKRWIPPPGKGSLYIRPLLLGTGAVLGLAPAPEYTFLIYVSPVGNYFKAGMEPIDLKVDTYYHRAAAGGVGGVKTIGNYAPVLKTQLVAKSKGYSDVIYLDAVENTYIEEVSSCNIFVAKGNKIATPDLDRGTILPGITRKSIIQLARSLNYEVEERPVAVEELMDAEEVFCTGTAVVVNPVASVTYGDRRVKYTNGGLGHIAAQLYKALTDVQMGKAPDKWNWIVKVA